MEARKDWTKLREHHPNILWICTDSQRHDTLGCYGNSFVRTPNIDRLASQGVLFERVFSQNPLCTPSRGSFLTGRYPITSGLRQNGQNIRPTEKLVTRLLADEGYVCGLAGKLHLHACDHRIRLFGQEGWKGKQANLFFRGVEERIDDGYAEMFWDHAPKHETPSSAYKRWLLEKGATYQTTQRDDSKYLQNGMPGELHQTTFCVDKAIGFIQAYEDSPYPWLFSVNIFDPHFPFDPPESYLSRYLDKLDDIPLPDVKPGELDRKPPYQLQFASASKYDFHTMNDRDHRMLKAAYWAMVDQIDEQVGRLLDALERTGQRENTIIVFTSDHGELLGDHGLYLKGPFLYDSSIHVPLIISYPKAIEGGRRSDALVELADLAPTLLEGAGLERYPGMQTRSLWSYLTQSGPLGEFRSDVY
ncbi:MAG: sulfatase, partial [Paenibacillaceae bacterium]|nr:sulfatase [Paenibacillaceae bacterium]